LLQNVAHAVNKQVNNRRPEIQLWTTVGR